VLPECEADLVKPFASNAILVAIAQYVHRKLWPSNPLYSASCARFAGADIRSLSCVGVLAVCAHTATAFISVLRYWFITFMAFYRKYLIAKALEEKFQKHPAAPPIIKRLEMLCLHIISQNFIAERLASVNACGLRCFGFSISIIIWG